MVAASLTFALMLALAFVRHFWLLNLFEFSPGFAWIAVLSTLNLGAQRAVRHAGKARALAVLSDGVLRLDDRQQRPLGTESFRSLAPDFAGGRHAGNGAGERDGVPLEAGERS